MFAELLAGAGLVSSILGKKGDKGATTQSGFANLPPEVQKVLLETYLPAAQKQFEKPYQSSPMRRAKKPSSIFDSQGLYDLQQYSDSMGGMFSPVSGGMGKIGAYSYPGNQTGTPNQPGNQAGAGGGLPGQEGQIMNMPASNNSGAYQIIYNNGQWRPVEEVLYGGKA